MRWLRRHGVRDFSVRVTTVAALVAATRAGAGLALVPDHLAGDLERVLPRARMEPVAIHLVAHPDVRRLAHVRAFAGVLRSHFSGARTQAG
jgi:DNA-binding transcriptional LysR family regulator